jgi:hypothetical protein
MPCASHACRDRHLQLLAFSRSITAGQPEVCGTNSTTTGITINNAGSGNAHAIVQSTIVCNCIIRIIVPHELVGLVPSARLSNSVLRDGLDRCFSEVLCKAARRQYL